MNYCKGIVIVGIVILCQSCRKTSGTLVSPASVNIINAISGSNPIIPVFNTNDTIQYFSNAVSISYAVTALYSPLSGNNTLYVVENSDTTQIDLKEKLFSGSFNLAPGGIYSFFLAGDTLQPDTLFIKDNIPHYTDSVAGVRFINLSPGSESFYITLQGNPATQKEFSNLNYKAASSFSQYNANSSGPGIYTFELRDQATDSVLLTYPWTCTLFKNNTLIISGVESSSGASPLLVFQMNNY